MKNKIKYFSVLLILAGTLFIHFYLPRIITEIKNPIISIIKGNYYQSEHANFSSDPSNGKLIEFSSFDKTKLKAYLTFSKLDSSRGNIILLHGIRSYKEHFISISEYLSEAGFNVIAIDSRAHGESEGTHCTFGVKEKHDIKYLIDYIKNEKFEGTIGIWGQSLGGAIGLESLAFDNRIEFGIIESTFSELSSITNDYLSNRTNLNLPFFSNYLLSRAGQIADFDPNQAKPINACKLITQPVLLVHGDADRRINIQYSKNNFENLTNPNSKYLVIENANHLNVWKVGGHKYFNIVLEFISKNSG